MKYRLVEGQGVDTLTVFNDVRSDLPTIITINGYHVNWDDIKHGLANGDDNVLDLFDIGTGVAAKMVSVSDRISWDGRNILWDGDPLRGVHASILERALNGGQKNFFALAKFIELLETNPSENSRAQAYTWLETHDFNITENGYVVGYKNVAGDPVQGMKSHASGTAYVNGVKHQGQIPNPIGAIVTMPRSEVNSNPDIGCHTGLHVGDWSFVNYGTGTILEVHVNPRDIVSIPRDEQFRKMRCCRYKVIRPVTEQYDGGVVVLPNTSEAWAGDVGYKV